MPQWDFLDFLAEQARALPARSSCGCEAEVTGLIEEGGRVAGVRVETPDGPQEIRADLVVGADGRHSVVRERAGLAVDRLRRADRRAVDAPVAARRTTRCRRSATSRAGTSW